MSHWTFKQTEASLYRWISPPFLQGQSAAPDNKRVIKLICVFSAMRQFIVSEHLHEPVTC